MSLLSPKRLATTALAAPRRGRRPQAVVRPPPETPLGSAPRGQQPLMFVLLAALPVAGGSAAGVGTREPGDKATAQLPLAAQPAGEADVIDLETQAVAPSAQ